MSSSATDSGLGTIGVDVAFNVADKFGEVPAKVDVAIDNTVGEADRASSGFVLRYKLVMSYNTSPDALTYSDLCTAIAPPTLPPIVAPTTKTTTANRIQKLRLRKPKIVAGGNGASRFCVSSQWA
jgi:hypothetical protein